ncbi:MAG: maleylpyruvate isomerase family mycothiol-dependent enzyme [Actinomycetota bacterium]|nr:maleylpyruvate isomerase family mycothiol-dependent enzyme [Actinomycetota bacterium]MDQ2956293.1 maleylpyruvate isomerase family mycothiol-dependent enzyme [Actinomycetota bacterium]
MTAPAVPTSVTWLAEGTGFLLDQLDVVDLAAASGLPGWTNGHVGAHLARNADALLRLMHWASTGEQTPMYASAAARDADIGRDAQRDPAVIRADVRRTAALLDDAIAAADERTWAARIRSTRKEIGAAEVPWMRAKEVWLHAVDLGASPAGLPPELATALLADIAGSFADRAEVPPVRLVDSESGNVVEIGAGGPTVTGPVGELALWLAGRSTGQGLRSSEGVPELPPWL